MRIPSKKKNIYKAPKISEPIGAVIDISDITPSQAEEISLNEKLKKLFKYLDPTDNGLYVKGTMKSPNFVRNLKGWGINVNNEGDAFFKTVIAGEYIKVFIQASVPTSLHINDIWYKSDDSYKKYYAVIAGATTIAAGQWVEANYQDDTLAIAAQAAADAAQADATSNIALLADIADDAKITPIEKLTIKPLWDAIVAEKTDIDTQADTYSVSKTAYGTAYTNLNNYLNTTITVFANMTATTNITRTTWDGYWEAYYNAKIEILNAIANAIQTNAAAAQTSADAAQADATTAIADAATAQTAADTAQADATTGIADAATAQAELDNIAADTKITPVEKLTAKQLWDAIVVEGTADTGTIPVQATAFGVSDADFDTAYAALNTYLNTTIDVFANMATTTTVVRATWDTAWKDYYDKRTKLLNAIATAAKTLADTAQSAADTAQTDATTAITNAATAQTAANDAQTDATANAALLTNIALDTKITPVEKLTLKPLWNAIVAEKTDIDTQADSYSVSKVAYGTAYTNLNTYLNTTITVFANMTATTTIVRATWDGFWEAYYNAKIEILNAIADATALLANWSAVNDDDGHKPADDATVGATAGTDLEDSGANVLSDDEVINKFIEGDALLQSADNEQSNATDTPTKKKDINIDTWGGKLRVKFDLKTNSVSQHAKGRIYKNGVGVGTIRENTTTSYVTYSEDIEFSVGDNLQIYVWMDPSGVGQSFVQNFRLYKLDVEATTVVLN